MSSVKHSSFNSFGNCHRLRLFYHFNLTSCFKYPLRTFLAILLKKFNTVMGETVSLYLRWQDTIAEIQHLIWCGHGKPIHWTTYLLCSFLPDIWGNIFNPEIISKLKFWNDESTLPAKFSTESMMKLVRLIILIHYYLKGLPNLSPSYWSKGKSSRLLRNDLI